MHTQNTKLRLGLIISSWLFLTGEIYAVRNRKGKNSNQTNRGANISFNGGRSQSLINPTLIPPSMRPVPNNQSGGSTNPWNGPNIQYIAPNAWNGQNTQNTWNRQNTQNIAQNTWNRQNTLSTIPNSWNLNNVANIPEYQPRSWDIGSSSVNTVPPATQYPGTSTNYPAGLVWDPALTSWVPNVSIPAPSTSAQTNSVWDPRTGTWVTAPNTVAASTPNPVRKVWDPKTLSWVVDTQPVVPLSGGACSLLLSNENAISNEPVTYTTDSRGNFSIVQPQNKDQIYINNGQRITMLCSDTTFSMPGFKDKSELSVVCNNGALVYNNIRYLYEQFLCVTAPKAFLIKTNTKCQKHFPVVNVGFQTSTSFLTLYSTCFDLIRLSPLYSWYEARRPYFMNIQYQKNVPSFTKTEILYYHLPVENLYTVAQQKKTFSSILQMDEINLDKYIINDYKHFLARGHYVPRGDFYHGFEQRATYFYSNAAPQWQVFNGGLWHKVEFKVRVKLSESTGRQIVLTGSLGSSRLPNYSNRWTPLFLNPPDQIPVPRYFWKMIWDVKEKKGIVYIGLNNPYDDLKTIRYMCTNTCSGDFTTTYEHVEGTNDGLIYCCDASEFRNNYSKYSDHGQLDSSLFM